MDKLYLDYVTRELLKEFGAGSHKPGSGSGAALQALLSAQLILTVIDRTLNKPRYSHIRKRLLEIEKIINEEIYPVLENLFQKDSEQFHKHMELRLAKINEKDPIQKRELEKKALVELALATEIPIEIANNCIKLVEYSFLVFDKAFHAVRGDSGVAMSSAVSAIGGCISIVDLNLLSFQSNKWTDTIRREVNELRKVFTQLSSEASDRLDSLKQEVDQHLNFHKKISTLLNSSQKKSRTKNKDVEKIARSLQNTLWKYRKNVWKKSIPEDYLEVLDPEKALTILGYVCSMETSLGQHTFLGQLFEIAGIIDTSEKLVSISEQFPPAVRNFTTAHELGHALLHKDMLLHRDRPKDGTSTLERDSKEREADKFASFFLMPENLIRPAFIDRFLIDPFVINEESAFALNEASTASLRRKCMNLHGLAKRLAGTEFYNGSPFVSLSVLFGVSIDAMAIRLEELGLVEF